MFEDLFSTTGISLERLRTLCLVVEAGSIAKAAENDPNTASLYSRHLKDLQQFVGARLVARKGKTVRATPVGLELAGKAKAFFKSLEDLKVAVSDGTKRIVVGAGEAAIYWLVFPMLGKIQNAYPACYEFENLRTKQIHEGLEQSKLDIGVVRSDAVEKGFHYTPLGEIEFALFAPKSITKRATGNPLTVLNRVPMGALMGTGSFNRNLARALDEAGIKPRLAVRTESFPMLKEAMKSNPMAAFLPKQAEEELKHFGYKAFHISGIDFLRIKYSTVYHEASADIRNSIRIAALHWIAGK